MSSICLTFLIVALFRAVELRPDLSCLWKLLGDACTAVNTVSPNRVRVLVPLLLVGLDPNSQNPMLNQAQALKLGERYVFFYVHPWCSTGLYSGIYSILIFKVKLTGIVIACQTH